jgi:GAF domain-containing protein
VDLQLQPFGERIDHRDADAMQAAGDLVGVLVEFPAGVQLGHDHLGRRDALALVDVGGNAAAVVGDGDRAVGVQDHLDPGGPAGEGLVDGVVDHLIDHVVQARAVVGVADIHARPLADSVQALENLDGIRAILGLAVVFGNLGLVGHLASGWGKARATVERARLGLSLYRV